MRGFSLIEMIAAFLIFAIGMGVLMGILTTAIRNTRRSSDYTMAALWAQSKLDVVGVGVALDAGSSSGRFDDKYSWQLDVQQVDPTSVEPPPQQTLNAGNSQIGQPATTSVNNAGNGGNAQAAPFNLFQVDLTVLWGGQNGGSPHSAHFSTLRTMNPDPDQPQQLQLGGASKPFGQQR